MIVEEYHIEDILEVDVVLELVTGHNHSVDGRLQVSDVGGEFLLKKHRFDAQSIVRYGHQVQQEFLGVAQSGRVAVVGLQHLHFVHRRQDLQQSAQLLRADVVVRSFLDHLSSAIHSLFFLFFALIVEFRQFPKHHNFFVIVR